MERTSELLLWLLLAFFSGTLPFSVWIGRFWLGTDIRTEGDANPGATNVLRAALKEGRGQGAAGVALLLDFLKGAIPVGLAHVGLAFDGWQLILIAIAPILGHAYTPFLRGRGGKAVATSGGIWCGLTIWEGPTIGGFLLGIATWLFGTNGWAVVSALGGMVLYLLWEPFRWESIDMGPGTWETAVIGALNLAIVGWKHRVDLRQRPRLRWNRSGSNGP